MRQILPIPRNPRDLIELFSAYDPRIGIDSVLDAFDSQSMTAADVFAALSGEILDPRVAAPLSGDYQGRVHMRLLLEGPQFRVHARQLIANAFPEKRRVIFVHIPKCAGSDMGAELHEKFATLPHEIYLPENTPAEIFFLHLRDFSQALRSKNGIALIGHERLDIYQEQNLIREQDLLFTILRDPAEIVYSFINFALTICKNAKYNPRGDVPHWLNYLNVTEIAEDASVDEMMELARFALYKGDTPNTICEFLGKGTANDAMARVVATNIEITDTVRYPAWRQSCFPGAKMTRYNASYPYFTPQTATAGDRDHIAQITGEDQKFYDLIQSRLAKTGRLSLRGRELA